MTKPKEPVKPSKKPELTDEDKAKLRATTADQMAELEASDAAASHGTRHLPKERAEIGKRLTYVLPVVTPKDLKLGIPDGCELSEKDLLAAIHANPLVKSATTVNEIAKLVIGPVVGNPLPNICAVCGNPKHKVCAACGN